MLRDRGEKETFAYLKEIIKGKPFPWENKEEIK
jgi:hypothetical protein